MIIPAADGVGWDVLTLRGWVWAADIHQADAIAGGVAHGRPRVVVDETSTDEEFGI